MVALALAAASCGGATTGPSAVGGTTSSTLHAEITDPAGDAIADARVSVAPDLVQASADVSGGNITFVIRLAAGTLERQSTRISLLLDTDENLSTGIGQADGVGADYGIDIAAASGLATVTRGDAVACAARQSCFTPVGSASIAFITDGVQVSVPLSLLGNDEGRMTFQVSSYVLVAALTPIAFDYMPENRLPPARVQ